MSTKQSEVLAGRPAAHTDNAPFGFENNEKSAWSVGFESGYDAARLEIASLHAQLEAVGAGGVSPLIGASQAQPHVSERDAYVIYLTSTFPNSYSEDEANRWWSQEHISALTWEARAALASQVQPVAGQSRFAGETEWGACTHEHVTLVLATPGTWEDYEVRYLYAAPQPAAQALDARIRAAGNTLANAAFNLSQQGGQVLDERAAKTLGKCQAEWDAAIAAQKGTTP